ncbi:MAG: hypothetical protein DCC68_25405 [Planctomycetota bacterium]|nr:MAG: hypothetical protein DCC68_25405 [Planctomycetota bacterium]
MKKPTPEMTLREFVRYHLRKRGCASVYFALAVDAVGAFAGRTLNVADLSDQLIGQWREANCGGLAPSTAKNYLTHLHALWRHAAELGIASPAPAGKGRLPNYAPQAAQRSSRKASMALLTLFDFIYLPARLSGKNAKVAGTYRSSIKWFCHSLGRSARPDDLTPDTFRAFYRFCAEKGRSPATIENHRMRLAALAEFAFDAGYLANRPYIPHVDPRDDGKAKPTPWNEEGTLAWFYANRYKPEAMQGLRPSTVATYDSAVNAYLRYAGVDLPIDMLDAAGIDVFETWLREAGSLSENVIGRYPQMMRRILKHFRPPAVVTVEPPTLMRPETPAAEMTLRWFFENCYLPERPVRKSTEYTYRLVIRRFGEYLGRDAMLEDFTAAAINGFLVARQGVRSSHTVKGERLALLTFWRSAFDWGYVHELPRRIRKVKPPVIIPEAFTPQEIAALREATADTRFDREANGVHVGRFLNALIRMAYDTALRLGDLLTLTRDQLGGSGLIVMTMAKTGLPHTCQVRPSTVAALAAIARDDDDRLLPWRRVRACLHKYWRRLLRVAGLPVHRRYGVQRLRRTSASYVEAIAPGSATGHLGHRTGDMARKHYLDPRLTSKALLPPDIPEPPKRIEGPSIDESREDVA